MPVSSRDYVRWTYDPNGSTNKQHPIVFDQTENQPTRNDCDGAKSEYISSAQAICCKGQEETQEDISQQGEGHEQSDPCVGVSQLGQVKRQHEGCASVGKQSDETLKD